MTWFTQVPAPAAPPRRRAPGVRGMVCAALPLVVSAIAGIVALGRLKRARTRPAPAMVALVAASDVAWCAADLFSKQLLLVPAALLEPTAVAYWLTAVAALAPPLLLMLVLPRRARGWALWACGVFGTLVILADVVYYRFFGDVMSAPALLAAHQTGHVIGSIRSLLTWDLLWLVIDLPFALWLVVRLRRLSPVEWLPRRAPRVVAAGIAARWPLAGLALSAPRVLASSQLDQIFRNRAVVEQLGSVRLSRVRRVELRARDAAASAGHRRAGGGGARVVRRARAAARRRRAGVRRRARKNLIVVQVESLQDFAVDYRVGGQDVMPHLRHVERRQPALHERHRSDQRRPHVGRRVHDARVAAAARPRRRRVPLSRQSLRRPAARPRRARLRDAVGGAVRAGLLEPARDAPVIRVHAEPVRDRLSDDRADRLGTERSRLPPADDAAARAAAAAVLRVAHHAVAASSVRRFPRGATRC